MGVYLFSIWVKVRIYFKTVNTYKTVYKNWDRKQEEVLAKALAKPVIAMYVDNLTLPMGFSLMKIHQQSPKIVISTICVLT